MRVTQEIKDAIEKAIEAHGNVSQFAKTLGIAHSTVLFWQSGKTAEISGRLWVQKLRPALARWLSSGCEQRAEEAELHLSNTGFMLESLIRSIVRDEIAKAQTAAINPSFIQNHARTRT